MRPLTILLAAAALALPAPAAAQTACDRRCELRCHFKRCPVPPGESTAAITTPQPENEDPDTGRVAVFKEWSVHRVIAGEDRHCWIQTRPIAATPHFEGREVIVAATVPVGDFSFSAPGGGFEGFRTGFIALDDTTSFGISVSGSDGWFPVFRDQQEVAGILADGLFLRAELQGEGFAISGAGFLEAFAHGAWACLPRVE